MAVVFPDREASRGPAFGRAEIDRLAEHRGDAGRMRRLMDDPDADWLVFAGDKVVFPSPDLRDPRHRRDGLEVLSADPGLPILLGVWPATGRAIFACDSALTEERLTALGRGHLADVRTLALAGVVRPEILSAVAQAAACRNWHATHGFCARCGQPSRMVQMGWRRDCQACGSQHFPRTDPVVIMLAIDGDRCLLGRQARFPPGMYSALAGFMEPGETLEEATRREIFEESGIRCGAVSYYASQPWPFPMSLMVGLHAQAETTEIVADTVELEDCRWFSRQDCRAMLKGTHSLGFHAPKPMAIAHHLLRAFVEP